VRIVEAPALRIELKFHPFAPPGTAATRIGEAR
jgi:hypothetical protein